MEKILQERYNFFIGLKDKDTKKSKMTQDEFISLVNEMCKSENIGFSAITMNGGYIHCSGEYVVEDSIKLAISGISEETAIDIAKDLKRVLNQECVMVTKEVIDTYIV